ncbi:DegT/DnrJ/EryC1/StrS family aminotransferase [Propionispora vibrioides]|uniref:dTDP-4-amino-4,6-dideoxygalactose transaminase n=1 Tax=Propionispora vibrioides TaxID=112903 RepID=A0A1H8RWQ2_9FIRM|nr:DegT/DnrJ/EryC1/StrS family aminotransferase [Propionispora vibrioides]SEO70717.1 dTDP-4-amino-4,6-dideoxygalactose transaminase [Propionispora vibrioides]
MIKLSSPSLGIDEYRAVERVLRSGQLVHGEECELFEQELARYLDCKEVIIVSSGTAALHLALVALGIGVGDAVLVPDFTFPATVNVVELVGARPILVDVDLHTYNITPENIQAAIDNWQGTEKVKAIMPVHEFGCPANMTEIMTIAKKHNLLVIEDAACGLGATHQGKKVGTFGQAGCFSFHPRKAITTGEGGAIVTNDAELAAKLRIWRNHGMRKAEQGIEFVLPGFNYRLTNFQAAMGRAQLVKFDGWLQVRSKLQQLYRQELAKTELLLPNELVGHAWQTFMVVLPQHVERSSVIARLKEMGIEASLGAQAVHCQPYYQQKYSEMCRMHQKNNAERLYIHGLALPHCQDYSIRDIQFVSQKIREILK